MWWVENPPYNKTLRFCGGQECPPYNHSFRLPEKNEQQVVAHFSLPISIIQTGVE
ncbi:MAG: hypothetical protein IKZ88_09105 [Neisseriaceae bacterium]|nr:hypothetical protein [Neisseriaceae bacterium]